LQHLLTTVALVSPIDGIAQWISQLIDLINRFTHSYGWSMLVLAALVRLGLSPLYLQQMKAGKEMQALQPYIKILQKKYKGDARKLQQEQMALFREHGVNPLGGCLPLLATLPVMWAIYRALALNSGHFKQSTWLWIGSHVAHQFPQWLAVNLASSDKLLLTAYAVSMYFFTLVTPTASADPQQRQMMRMNAFIMPVMLFFFGRGWPAAFVLYWLGFNLLSIAQQWYVMRLPSRIPAPPEETDATRAGFPLNCPHCNKTLTIVKHNRCENCGAKVRKLGASGDGAAARKLPADGGRNVDAAKGNAKGAAPNPGPKSKGAL
jgi:YidC/Oxa1 family membrane protein insertase